MNELSKRPGAREIRGPEPEPFEKVTFNISSLEKTTKNRSKLPQDVKRPKRHSYTNITSKRYNITQRHKLNNKRQKNTKKHKNNSKRYETASERHKITAMTTKRHKITTKKHIITKIDPQITNINAK